MTVTKGKLTNLTILLEIDGETGIVDLTQAQMESVASYLIRTSEQQTLTLIALPDDIDPIYLSQWDSEQVH